jgi:endonuclease I
MKKYLLKTCYSLIVTLLLSAYSFAQIPAGYYDGLEGIQGEPLRSALFQIIKNPNVESYDGLWGAFEDTDLKSNGKVWDMYSDVPGGTPSYEFTFVSDQCGNYGGEGDCFNREHSFPKSWFNESTPMYSDLFHLYPTDGYVNGMRSNYPFGEVGSASYTSTNGSKRGSSNYPGYSGTVFEPIDDYKGDFARSYFYMLTCYYDKITNWSCPMITGNNFTTWSRNMLLEWHRNDPVSQKEINRNNAIYDYQGNRNPFIDNPLYADAIWDPNYVSSSMIIYENSFSVFPNPASERVELKLNESTNQITSIFVTDVCGRVIYKDENACENEIIDIQNWQNGAYFLFVKFESGLSSSQKFVVLH